MDDDYLARKERIAMYDKREIIPTCVITVVITSPFHLAFIGILYN